MDDDDSDLFQAMLAGKIKDIREAIDEIEAEVKEREDIDQKTLGEIQDEVLQIRNRILEVQQITGTQNFSSFPAVETLQKEILVLEGEKRFEKLNLWRDIATLRKELRAYMRELNDLLRRAKLVNQDAIHRGIG